MLLYIVLLQLFTFDIITFGTQKWRFCWVMVIYIYNNAERRMRHNIIYTHICMRYILEMQETNPDDVNIEDLLQKIEIY